MVPPRIGPEQGRAVWLRLVTVMQLIVRYTPATCYAVVTCYCNSTEKGSVPSSQTVRNRSGNCGGTFRNVLYSTVSVLTVEQKIVATVGLKYFTRIVQCVSASCLGSRNSTGSVAPLECTRTPLLQAVLRATRTVRIGIFQLHLGRNKRGPGGLQAQPHGR